MPSPIRNNWSLKKLLQITQQYAPNRFDYRDRDVLRRIEIVKVHVYDGKRPGEARTTYKVRSSSYPQYYPYKTKTDSRGRQHTYQRKYKHSYEVTLQLDRLSVNAPVKLRTGASRKWDPAAKTKITRNRFGRIVSIKESKNVLLGINGDFVFRLEWVYAQEGILYGRCWATTPPGTTNPVGVPFLDKHAIGVVTALMKQGVLKDD
jgi:hypothetical protein